VEGTLQADTRTQAITQLEHMGYLPVRVEEERGALSVKETLGGARRFFQRISSKDLNAFTRQLASLVQSKVQLVRALDILYRETPHIKLKEIILNLRDEVREGRQLSNALAKYPRYFSRVYINMTASGEKSGTLESTLLRLAEFTEREEEMKSKVRAALAYPIVILTMGVLTVFVVLAFVMPRVIGLFSEFGQALPLPTRILIAVSEWSGRYWMLVILIAAGIIVMIQRSRILERKRLSLDKTMLRLPWLGNYIRIKEIARFSRTLGLLMTHGIPIREAIEVTVPTLENRALEEELKIISGDLASGSSVAASMSKISFLPGYVASLIGVGEEAGRLDKALLEVAHTYERELEEQHKVMSSLLEPLLILAVGLVVGFIVVSMLLPIFQMSLR